MAGCGAEAAGTLRARVVDASSGAGIAGAEVVVMPGGQHVVTDSVGRFPLPVPRNGTTEIVVARAEGFVRGQLMYAGRNATTVPLRRSTPAVLRSAAATSSRESLPTYTVSAPRRLDTSNAPNGAICNVDCALCPTFDGQSLGCCVTDYCTYSNDDGSVQVYLSPGMGVPYEATECGGSSGVDGGYYEFGPCTDPSAQPTPTPTPTPAPAPPPPPPDQVVSANDASNTTFTYKAGCLVFADDGSAASSNAADISFYLTTFAAGSEPASSLPFVLLAATPAGPTPQAALQDFVSIDVSAYQGGRRLDVASGTACAVGVTLSQTIAPWVNAALGLYVASGYGNFTQVGGLGAPLTWDAGSNRLSWPVTSLNSWTAAKQANSSGGCVSGAMLNACDGTTRVPFRTVRVNVMDGEGTRAWTGVTDAAGRYCLDAPLDSFWPGMDLQVPQPPISYFVSGASLAETAMCDPLPDGSGAGQSDCRTCQPALQNVAGGLNICTLCALTDPLPPNPTSLQFADTCAAAPHLDPLRQATLQPCSFCPPPAPLPGACVLSDGSVHAPTITECAPLDTTLGYGALPNGQACQCKFAGSACDYTTDQCCFLAPRDASVVGLNQGGCQPGAINLQQGTCGRCTVSQEGGVCDASRDICCNGDDPSILMVCFDSVCVRAAASAKVN